MKIHNFDGVNLSQVNFELQNGAKFIMYEYCISIFIMTFKRSSDIYYIKANTANIRPRIIYSIISLLFGWWGIPWGPIYTISSVYRNIRGGKNVTNDVLSALNSQE